MLKNIDKREWLLITGVYSWAHGLLLVITGIYGEDWWLIGLGNSARTEIFKQSGVSVIGTVHNFMLGLPEAVTAYRIVTFISFLLATLFLNELLRTVKALSVEARLSIALLFAVFPVNQTRIALIVFPYSLAYLFFFCGFWALGQQLLRGSGLFRIFSLTCFFLSFFVNSFLVFYGLVPLYIYYLRKDRFKKQPAWKAVACCADFLILPLLFWAIKSAFLKPFGVFANYNEIDVKLNWLAPIKMAYPLYSSFISVFDAAIQSFSFFAIIIGIIIFLLLDRVSGDAEKQNAIGKFFGIGLIAFFLAVLPYIVVGKYPSVDWWESRNQILVPLGAACMTTFGLYFLATRLQWKPTTRRLALGLVMGILSFLNIHYYVDEMQQDFKQRAFIKTAQAAPQIVDNTTFVFKDEALSSEGIALHYLVLTGMLNQALMSRNRFGENLLSLESPPYNAGRYMWIPYISENYQPKAIDYLVTLQRGSCRESPLVLKGYQIYGSPFFDRCLSNMLTFSFSKFDG